MYLSSAANSGVIIFPVATMTNSKRCLAGFGFNAAVDEKKQDRCVFPSQLLTVDERDWDCPIPPQKAFLAVCVQSVFILGAVVLS